MTYTLYVWSAYTVAFTVLGVYLGWVVYNSKRSLSVLQKLLEQYESHP